MAWRAGLSNQGWQPEQSTLCLSCYGSVLSNENPQLRVSQEGQGPASALPPPCSGLFLLEQSHVSYREAYTLAFVSSENSEFKDTNSGNLNNKRERGSLQKG